MAKPHMPQTTKRGNQLRTRDMVTGAGSHRQKHPFSYGFKASSDDAGKRKKRGKK